MYSISADLTNRDFQCLAFVGFDNDGDMVVMSGRDPLSMETQHHYIWKNISSDGNQWEEHIILTGKLMHEAVTADVDGEIDICSKPGNNGQHIYLENKLID